MLSESWLAVSRQFPSNCAKPSKLKRKGASTMKNYAGLRIMIFALLPFVVAGCPSTSATSCAGWRQNNLSPAGLVALTKVDRPAAERVEGNDENGKRRGCWK